MENNKALEAQIRRLFTQSRRSAKTTGQLRLRAILSRALHEIAFRDLLSFAGNLAITMFTVLKAYLKLLFRSR